MGSSNSIDTICCSPKSRRGNGAVWRQALREMSSQLAGIAKQAGDRQWDSHENANEWCQEQLKQTPLMSQTILRALWAEYDVDHNGELSSQELHALIRDYFTVAKTECTDLIYSALVQQLKESCKMSDEEIRLFFENPANQELLSHAKQKSQSLFSSNLLEADVNALAKTLHIEVFALFGIGPCLLACFYVLVTSHFQD